MEAFDPGSAKTYPKLGLLSLVSYLRHHVEGVGRIDVRVHDMLLEGLSFDDVEAMVRAFERT